MLVCFSTTVYFSLETHESCGQENFTAPDFPASSSSTSNSRLAGPHCLIKTSSIMSWQNQNRKDGQLFLWQQRDFKLEYRIGQSLKDATPSITYCFNIPMCAYILFRHTFYIQSMTFKCSISLYPMCLSQTTIYGELFVITIYALQKVCHYVC